MQSSSHMNADLGPSETYGLKDLAATSSIGVFESDELITGRSQSVEEVAILGIEGT